MQTRLHITFDQKHLKALNKSNIDQFECCHDSSCDICDIETEGMNESVFQKTTEKIVDSLALIRLNRKLDCQTHKEIQNNQIKQIYAYYSDAHVRYQQSRCNFEQNNSDCQSIKDRNSSLNCDFSDQKQKDEQQFSLVFHKQKKNHLFDSCSENEEGSKFKLFE